MTTWQYRIVAAKINRRIGARSIARWLHVERASRDRVAEGAGQSPSQFSLMLFCVNVKALKLPPYVWIV